MNRKKKLDKLMTVFTEEKKFILDGYYRIRTINEDTIELAYLIAGPCGESIVHPQITVSLATKPFPIAIKLIDMVPSPPLFLIRDTNNMDEIDLALDALIEKFTHLL
ncbi:hypothetical protein [Enterococcus caccae]|uniref:Uncharacterized protein n=1 Tax=Enterococcus caccae ATCC BAA-1240 TaxID=1158612 RepID=R3U4Y1_9ENTE|nr:hypothetical protein [Enterococcus caccae]EOL48999.1 hypothetical protein UC7_00844 [Enterococcus caccae ATCC BAA-1240]EOT65392.1 hypothetical protein I580_01148 [Enterococcus caccae ATCC BAA-1240]OJG25034.1 hypothetical protein RU98_GL001135 [Enterococcus caccae]